MSNEEYAIFEISNDENSIYCGSMDDGYYNWSVDITDFSVEQKEVLKKLEDKVRTMSKYGMVIFS